MRCTKAQAVTGFGRLEQYLQVSVRPLPQRAIGARATARVEHLAQLHHETLPLFIGEPAVEIDRPSHANTQAEEGSGGAAEPHINRSGSLRDRLGRDADLAADRLELREGEPFVARD